MEKLMIYLWIYWQLLFGILFISARASQYIKLCEVTVCHSSIFELYLCRTWVKKIIYFYMRRLWSYTCNSHKLIWLSQIEAINWIDGILNIKVILKSSSICRGGIFFTPILPINCMCKIVFILSFSFVERI